MTYRKKLIEVALPLEAISVAAAQEKNIHTGHLANIHTWWSRKPLTAARAVLFASLVDDPGEYLTDVDKTHNERQRLFRIIERLVIWENNNDEDVLYEAQLEIARSVARNLGVQPPIGQAAVREFLAEKAPPVLDPFAGGGSIPLEAQRLGLRAYASDLNPVAVLINKALIEIPPRFAGRPPVHPPVTMEERQKTKREKRGAKGAQLPLQAEWKGVAGLAEDLRCYGKWVNDRAEERIGHFYPKVQLPKEYGGQEATVIAWLWARTVMCPNPACKAQSPLVNKFWVSTHKGNEAWAKPVVDQVTKTVQFDLEKGLGSPPSGTVNRSGARCLVCDQPISFDHIRSEGRNGRMGYQLMTIVAESQLGRIYVPPQESHVKTAAEASPPWIPETELPAKALGFRVMRYGMTRHCDLFTPRQLVALATFCDLMVEVREQVILDSGGDIDYADAVTTFLALSLSRLAQTNNTLVRWLIRKSGTSKGTPAFDRQIVSMVWEFSEGNIFGESVGSWSAALKNPLTAFNVLPKLSPPGKAQQLDASSEIALQVAPLVSTDPPYFDNIGYADLSDFAYIWLRRALGKIYPDIFKTLLVPKRQELIAAPHLFGGDQLAAENHFLEGLQKAFRLLSEKADPSYPVTVYYAFRQTEETEDEMADGEIAVSSTGWETMLEALLGAGFAVTGTWPIRTEQANRLRAIGANALASSIVLVCRPRPKDAPLVTRRDFLAELKKELPAAFRELQQGNIAPVDLAQAAIGPGMAVYSRYRQVLEADGSPMRVRAALALINQALDEYLTEQEGEYDSDTRWALAWFEQYGQESGPYGVAETLSKAKNTSPEGLVRAGILESRVGQVRLLRREELRADWDPRADERPTAWEAAQYLVRSLGQGGEQAAAALLAQLGALSDNARDLAYRLYTICERKNWAQEALGYNMLVVAWPRLVEMAARVTPQQQTMFN